VVKKETGLGHKAHHRDGGLFVLRTTVSGRSWVDNRTATIDIRQTKRKQAGAQDGQEFASEHVAAGRA